MNGIQDEISEWAERIFEHDQESITRHMLSEVAELCHTEGINRADALAIVNRTFDKREREGGVTSEYEDNADVAILSLTLAGYSGYSLAAAINYKMGINKERNWGARNALGFAEHITPVKDTKP